MSKKTQRKKQGTKKLGFKRNLFLVFIIILAVVFHPTTLLLSVGMLPTFVVLLVDRTQGKTKTFTVGAMNLAGCVPFVLEVWIRGHTVETAMDYIMQPRTIVVMYFAAAIGYLIEWAMIGIVMAVMKEKGKMRLKEIDKISEDLIRRWGKSVTGKIPLDPYGFPLETKEDKEEDKEEDA